MMIRQIWGYLRAWARGDDAELHIDKTFHLSWWDIGAIVVIIGLIVWRVWK